ncbi:MAG TPA: sulfite exporter TauE/SafE family protein [Cytophagaceae bacterium]
MDIFIPLILGFIGSLHCLGMCGPIALALPVQNRSMLGISVSALLYNGGRVISYSLLGLIAGLAGSVFFFVGAGQYLAIAAGVVIVITALLPFAGKNIISVIPFLGKLHKYLVQNVKPYFLKKNYSSLFITGLVNGFLPCGLLYSALIGAVATGSVVKAMSFMALFGLATLPAMFILILVKSKVAGMFRNKLMRFVPVAVMVVGILIMLRGLNLGIPYVSPKFNAEAGQKVKCH